MKVILTPAEAIAVLVGSVGERFVNDAIRRHFNLPPETGLEIQKDDDFYKASIRKCLSEINLMDYNGYQKISAIKRLRGISPMGLAEAKWAVENWRLFESWVRNRHEWPKFKGSYPHHEMY